jgi:probable HAF family extracellular repeat protein
MFTTQRSLLLIVTLLFAQAAARAAPSTYTLSELGDLGIGVGIYGNPYTVNDINDAGQVVGWARDQGNTAAPFLSTNGVMTLLGGSSVDSDGRFRGGFGFGAAINNGGVALVSNLYYSATVSGGITSNSFAGRYYGINNSGQLAGAVDDVAVMNTPGVGVVSLESHFSGFSYARDINDAGTVVGDRMLSNEEGYRAFIYSNGTMVKLGTLGGSESHATAINNSGMTVGYVAGGSLGAAHAFLYSNGTMTDLGTLGGNYSMALDINDAGEIVGVSSDADGRERAFLYSGGVMMDLNGLVSNPSDYLFLDRAGAINNNHQIAVQGEYAAGLLTLDSAVTPVPEPEAYATLLFGLALLGIVRGRQRAGVV